MKRQMNLFEETDWSDPRTPAEQWDKDAAKRSLDELFSMARQYRSSGSFSNLLKFVSRFHFYSPFNAMLVHVQMPGATYVAPANRWVRDFGRRIRANARPLVILQPKGPVMFVFDVSHTVPEDDATPLPYQVTHPFETRRGAIGGELNRTLANVKRDGVEALEQDAGSQSAGEIRIFQGQRRISFQWREKKEDRSKGIPLRYQLLLNSNHSSEAKYATLAHELGHLYCGHLGTPNVKWWPDRRGLEKHVREFEAESVCYLVCERLGIENPSDEYFSAFVKESSDTPPISLECVFKATGLIERMGREGLKPRTEDDQPPV